MRRTCGHHAGKLAGVIRYAVEESKTAPKLIDNVPFYVKEMAGRAEIQSSVCCYRAPIQSKQQMKICLRLAAGAFMSARVPEMAWPRVASA